MSLKLRELKKKTPQELLKYAEETGVENASSMRTQDMLFEILRSLASNKKDIDGEGVLEVLQDGFGFSDQWKQIICLVQMIFMLVPARSKGLD
jgi:transcription termination factor Rho